MPYAPGYILEYSIDGGVNWQLIGAPVQHLGEYSWNVPPGINSTQCLIRIKDDPNFSSTVLDVSDGVFTIVTPQLSQLLQINSANLDGLRLDPNQVVSFSWSIISPQVGLFNLSLPYDLSVDDLLPTLFSWFPASNASSYTLEVALDNLFTNIILTDVGSTNSRTISNLDYQTQYFWRVLASNDFGPSVYSNTQSFTTMAIPKKQVSITGLLGDNFSSILIDSNINMQVSPIDVNGNSNGSTPIVWTYAIGTSVTITANNKYNGSPFIQWEIVDALGAITLVNTLVYTFVVTDNINIKALYKMDSIVLYPIFSPINQAIAEPTLPAGIGISLLEPAINITSPNIQPAISSILEPAINITSPNIQPAISSINTFDILIGTQYWNIQNLAVTNFQNGDPIPLVTNPIDWANLTTPAYTYVDGNSANTATYGLLYNWYAVNDPRGLAPNGYHIPTNTEYVTLQTFVGGASSPLNKTGSNTTGLSLLFAGHCVNSYGGYGLNAHLWTSTDSTTLKACSVYIDGNIAMVVQTDDKFLGVSIRLIAD